MRTDSHIDQAHDHPTSVTTVPRQTPAVLLGFQGQPFSLLANQVAWILVGILCLMLGMMLVWQRGFYLDDYSNLLHLVDPVTGQTNDITTLRPPDFPARSLTWYTVALLTEQLPGHEFLVRLLTAVGVGINALLIGVLIFRLLFSRIGALVAGWLFLSPALASEAVLWLGASTYIFATTATLLYLLLAFEQLRSDTLRPLVLLGAYAMFGVAFLFGEGSVSAIGIVVLMSVWILLQRPRAFSNLVWRTVLAIAGPVTIVGLMYLFIYRTSTLVARRGGMQTDASAVVDRLPGFFARLEWMVAAPGWGKALFTEALQVGVQTIDDTPLGLFLAGATIVCMGIAIVTWRPTSTTKQPGRLNSGLLALIGLVWVIASLLFPTILVKGQILEYRLLYFPLAGFALTIGALTVCILGRSRNHIMIRVTVGLFACILLANTLMLLGFARAAAERSALDRRQVQALLTSVPDSTLPEGTVVVPYQLSELLFGHNNETPLSKILVGVFETPWSARAALEVAYRTKRVEAITANRWVPMTFSYQRGSSDITIQGQAVPIDRVLLFTYKDQQAFPITSITLEQADGQTRVVQFPLVRQLQDRGVKTIPTVTAPNLSR